GADVEMGFRRQAGALAGQGRPARGAEPAPGSSRGRIEFRDLALRHPIGGVFDRDEDGDRRAAMSATALAVAPIDALRPAGSDKTHGAAQATALELFGCVTHKSRPPDSAAHARSAAPPAVARRDYRDPRRRPAYRRAGGSSQDL